MQYKKKSAMGALGQLYDILFITETELILNPQNSF